MTWFFRHPSCLVKATAIGTLFLFIPLVASSITSYRAFNHLVAHEFQLQKLSDRITYLDEVLTMSARMNAATGDIHWEKRYWLNVAKLDRAIEDSIELAPAAYDNQAALQTNTANQQLIELEERSFQLVKAEQAEEALSLLLGAEYRRQKAIYSQGVEQRQQAIATQIQTQIANYRSRLWLSGMAASTTLVLLIPAWWQVLKLLQRYLTQLHRTQQELQSINEELEDRVHQRTQALQRERDRSEQLLLNILPPDIASQLKNNLDSALIAERFDNVTILFADIVGFTKIASSVKPIELVERLNRIFSMFDRLSHRYQLEKIKTIGDAYMVVGGLPRARDNSAQCVANAALAMLQEIEALNQEMNYAIQIRVGINTGSVVAGVIGLHKFIYDLWGDAVNIAARMEASSMPGRIQVSEHTYQYLKGQYHLEERGFIEVKGKGNMRTYWLLGHPPAVREASQSLEG